MNQKYKKVICNLRFTIYKVEAGSYFVNRKSLILKISPKGAVINSLEHQPGGYAIQYNISAIGA